VKKLAIGTAQFGQNYGVSNIYGQVKYITAKEILTYASKNNIKTLDTAIAYGNSEEILGKCGVSEFDVITKLPIAPKNVNSYSSWAQKNLSLSLERLNRKKIYGLLLHSSSNFLGKQGHDLYQTMTMFKEKGLVDKIGVSIYDPDELNILEDSGIKLDIVQTPFNMLDRRIETSGWLNKLSQNGTEVHSRSVFLQGLLLQDKNHRNPYFSKWRNYFNKLDSWIYDTKQTSLSAALNFSYSYKDINKLLVGVQNKLQLTEIINSISQDYSHSLPEELRIDDPLLINPTNWRL
jgi:aryl-alcohol dehydrogenase-like predicted oxidoreductase